MPISHGHKPYEYPEFVPELEAKDVINAVKLKQNLYDEGLSQVMLKQQELYNLPVARDVDREYVSKAIDNYNRIIKDNAHMDFSNPNTVRSFLQISAPLEQDPLVRNAIASTKELQNRQKTLSDIAQKNPKYYSEANAYHYLKDVQEWQNSKEVGVLLQPKEYVPYEDLSGISKKISELKAETIQSTKKLNGFLSQETIEQMTSDRVQEWLNSNLTDKQKNQMMIDANFEGLSIPDDDKKNQMSGYYYNIFSDYSNAAKDKNITPEEKKEFSYKAQAALESAAEIMNAPSSKLNDMFANYYTANYIKGLGDSYEYKNIKQELKANPFALAAQQSALRRKEADYKLERDKQLLAYKYQNGFVGNGKSSDNFIAPSIVANDKDNKLTFSKIQNGEEVTMAYENLDNTIKNKITDVMGSQYDPKGDLVILKKKDNDLIAIVGDNEIPLETFNNQGSDNFNYVDFAGGDVGSFGADDGKIKELVNALSDDEKTAILTFANETDINKALKTMYTNDSEMFKEILTQVKPKK